MNKLKKYRCFLKSFNDGKDMGDMGVVEMVLIHALFIGFMGWIIAVSSLLVTVCLMIFTVPSHVTESSSLVSFLGTTWDDPTISFWFSISKGIGIWSTVLFVVSALFLNDIASKASRKQTVGIPPAEPPAHTQ